MTREERALLLFFENCAVHHAGKVATVHLNDDDLKIAQNWNAGGFIHYGRVAFKGCDLHGSHWCRLSDEAWRLAHAERQAHADRMWLKRPWRTTEEQRAATKRRTHA